MANVFFASFMVYGMGSFNRLKYALFGFTKCTVVVFNGGHQMMIGWYAKSIEARKRTYLFSFRNYACLTK
jgi:hypothetical protein